MEHERSTRSEKTSAHSTDHALLPTPANAQDEVRQILDTSSTGITRCSQDLRYLSVNAAYAKLVGWPSEQIIGRAIVDVIGTEAFEVIRPYAERVLRGERVEYEAEVPYAGGGPRYIHVVYMPWIEHDGRVAGWVGSISDITDLKRVTTELQEREHRLRLALDASGGGSWTWDARTGRVDWDDRFRKLYGFTAEEPATAEAWPSRVHGEDRPRVLGVLDEILRTERNDWVNTFRIVRPDGSVAWIESRGQADRDADGHVSRLTGLDLDVTERHRAEEAQQEREQRLSLALDASAAGVWTWDPFTNQSRWDDRFHAQYGFAEGAPQTFDTWISGVHEEDRPKVLAHLDDVVHGHQDEWNIAFRAVRPDGTIVWMHGLGRADRAHDGQLTKMSGINLDITERRRVEEVLEARREEERERDQQSRAQEALRRSHAELEQRTLQLRRLASQLTLAEQTARRQLARMLHDGLQQLLFSAGITLDQAIKPTQQDDQARLLQKARADLTEAMEAARTLSVNLFPPVLHVGGLPAALSWLAKRTQEQYGIAVNVTADPQANPAASDVRILLFEAVRELLFNAAKHAHVDSVDVNLALGPGDTIHIQVSDGGVGFDMSATLHDKNQSRAGLGLFSIQERLALLGGKLDIHSATGKGSRFTLTLSRTGLPGLSAGGTEVQHRNTAPQERLVYDSADDRSKSLRILVADDHPVARAGLRELLGKRPELQVVGEAASGVEAITQAVALQPDVIVMDVSMPQMDGIDATREIHRTMRHIRIVGLSTHDDESTERLMRKAGAEAYFTKNEGTDRLLDYLLSLVTQAKGASAG
jgi:PAS domain S-box-containing protein